MSIRHIAAVTTATIATAVVVVGPADAAKLITGKNIKNGSIAKADLSKSAQKALKGKRGSAGADGVPGPAGPAGAAGAPGPAGAIAGVFTIAGPKVPVGATGSGDEVQYSVATCPAGSGVISGGYDTSAGVRSFIPQAKIGGNGYAAFAVNTSSLTNTAIQAFATCAPGGAAPTARSAVASKDVLDATLRSLRAAQAETR